MDTFLLSALDTVLGVVGTMFNLVFFWLPVDPLADYLDNVNVLAVAGQAVSWLNWFVDVSAFAAVLSTFVTVLLAFASWRVLAALFDLITKLVQAVNPF